MGFIDVRTTWWLPVNSRPGKVSRDFPKNWAGFDSGPRRATLNITAHHFMNESRIYLSVDRARCGYKCM